MLYCENASNTSTDKVRDAVLIIWSPSAHLLCALKWRDEVHYTALLILPLLLLKSVLIHTLRWASWRIFTSAPAPQSRSSSLLMGRVVSLLYCTVLKNIVHTLYCEWTESEAELLTKQQVQGFQSTERTVSNSNIKHSHVFMWHMEPRHSMSMNGRK